MNDMIKAYKLDDIFNRQEAFLLKLYKTKNLDHLKNNQQFINDMVLAAIVELTEVLNETAWKPWKQQQESNLNKFSQELADVLHFFINLCIAGGISAEEMYNQFIEKNMINHKRQDEGY